MEFGPQELPALLLLNRTPGIRMRGLVPFFERGFSPSEIVDWIGEGENPNWKESLEKTLSVFNSEKEIESCEKRGIQIISFWDSNYPFLLKEISDPPLVLYCKGELLEADRAAVAMVGSRHPSFYGIEQAKRFSSKLSRWGLTIVSGFARGVDCASHEAALGVSFGRTLAVLGSGLDVIYPKEHKSLFEKIQEQGAVISEFSLGTAPLAENFPKRNRIISGLSLGTLVVEAHSRSGSLITAHQAVEEGREVFALPGRVDQLQSRGTHRLIQEGALLVESPEEILDTIAHYLWPLVGIPSEDNALEEEEKSILNLIKGDPLTPNQVANDAKCPIAQITSLLTILELKRKLRKRADGRYERVSKECLD